MLSKRPEELFLMMAEKEAAPAAGGDAHGGGGGGAKHGGGKGGGHHKKGGHHAEDHVNLERWLVSYADFMTLLFCVFTVLYAMSVTDKQKVQEVARSVTKALGLGGPHEARLESSKDLDRGDVFEGTEGILDKSGKDVLSDLTYKRVARRERIEEPIDSDYSGSAKSGPENAEQREQAKQQKAKMEQVADMVENQLAKATDTSTINDIKIQVVGGVGVRITLPEKIAFPSGSAELRSEFQAALRQIASVLERVDNRVLIEGHTDNVPISTERYQSNWELSSARATTVLQFILSKYRISASRFSVGAYGEYRPVVPNDTPINREKNRRVEIIIQEKALPPRRT